MVFSVTKGSIFVNFKSLPSKSSLETYIVFEKVHSLINHPVWLHYGKSSARFSARKLIYGAFISTFLSPLHERGCSLRLCWGWMTHIIRGRLLGLLTLASSSSLLPNYFLHDFLISRRDCIHQLMGLITQVFLFYLDYLCSWQSMLAIACQIVFFPYSSTRCEE